MKQNTKDVHCTTWCFILLSPDNEDVRLVLRQETLQSVLYEDLSQMTFRRPTEVPLRCHRAIQSGSSKNLSIVNTAGCAVLCCGSHQIKSQASTYLQSMLFQYNVNVNTPNDVITLFAISCHCSVFMIQLYQGVSCPAW